MGKSSKRGAGALAALAVASGAVMAFAPQAAAGTLNTQVSCDVPVVGKQDGPQSITVDVTPASAAAGSKVKVKVTTGEAPIKSPLDVGKVKVTPTITFKLSNNTEATVTGPQQEVDIKKDTPQKLAPYEGDLTIPANASGKLDLTPTKMVTKTPYGDNVCTVTSGGGVVASVTISGGGTTGSGTTGSGTTGSGTTGSGTTGSGTTGSGTTGSGTTGSGTTGSGTTGTTGSGTTGSGTTGSTTGSSLPKTGPLDDALSMGLVGGTVGLLGIGAVLVATRKVRNSRNAAS